MQLATSAKNSKVLKKKKKMVLNFYLTPGSFRVKVGSLPFACTWERQGHTDTLTLWLIDLSGQEAGGLKKKPTIFFYKQLYSLIALFHLNLTLHPENTEPGAICLFDGCTSINLLWPWRWEADYSLSTLLLKNWTFILLNIGLTKRNISDISLLKLLCVDDFW